MFYQLKCKYLHPVVERVNKFNSDIFVVYKLSGCIQGIGVVVSAMG